MSRPDVEVVYDHENRCVWADNRKYVLKDINVQREHSTMTFEWEDKKLILEIGRGKTMGWRDRHHPDYRNSLTYDDGRFENPAHKFESWEDAEKLFAILFLCLEKYLLDYPRDLTGFDFDAYWNKSGFATYKFENVVVKRILSNRPNFVWTDPE